MCSLSVRSPQLVAAVLVPLHRFHFRRACSFVVSTPTVAVLAATSMAGSSSFVASMHPQLACWRVSIPAVASSGPGHGFCACSAQFHTGGSVDSIHGRCNFRRDHWECRCCSCWCVLCNRLHQQLQLGGGTTRLWMACMSDGRVLAAHGWQTDLNPEITTWV
jgi:hypothetical protein